MRLQATDIGLHGNSLDAAILRVKSECLIWSYSSATDDIGILYEDKAAVLEPRQAEDYSAGGSNVSGREVSR